MDIEPHTLIAAVLITGGCFSAMAAPAFDFIVDLRTADREDAAARGPGGFGHPGSRGGLLARCIQLPCAAKPS
jgi:hypothetical protein